MAKIEPMNMATAPQPSKPAATAVPVGKALSAAEAETVKRCAARVLSCAKLIVQQDDPDFSALVKIAERL